MQYSDKIKKNLIGDAMSVSDNGGAIAIKGFNFQKAAAILVILYNLKEKNFVLVPEASEDFEVRKDKLVYYVQVKSVKSLSVNRMITQDKDTQKNAIPGTSIIEKNLVPGNTVDRRKIIVSDLINKDRNGLIKIESELSISPSFIWSTEQKDLISSKLSLNDEQVQRLGNQEVFKTPFQDDMSEAIIHLTGVMAHVGLEVTKDSAYAALGTLGLMIDEKSEIIDDGQNKEITGRFIKKLFDKAHKSKLFEEILDGLNLSVIQKIKIKKEKVKIKQIYISLTTELEKKFDNSQFLGNNDTKEMIDLINQEVFSLDPTLNDNLALALSVDCLCNLME
ncbi:dsDNA nuclease domain-containing protein [Leuconostoc lactis]|uniref:dsDNA nuclease domain-containing protein n=1 Tax=Leuconostoc lactis TaxID=1246 RepID=UPI003D6BB3DB